MLNNSFIEVGRLVADAEAGTTSKGKPMSYFRIAVDNYYNGENHPDFLACHAFNKTAELLNNYGEKGRMIMVEVEQSNRPYTDKDGKKRWACDLTVTRSMFITSSDKRTKKADVDHPDYHQEELFSEEDYNDLMQNSSVTPDSNTFDHQTDESNDNVKDSTNLNDLSDTDKEALGLI